MRRKTYLLINILALSSLIACGGNERAGSILSQSSPLTAEWRELSAAPLPGARYGHLVVAYKGKLYSIGGRGTGEEFLSFDPIDTVWRRLPDLPEGQVFPSGAVLNGKIYVFGSYGPSDIVQIYNVTRGTWSKGPSLPVRSYWHSAEVVGREIFVIGGHAPMQAEKLYRTVYILDTETGKWRRGTDIPEPMQNPTTAVHGTDIYVFFRFGAYKYETRNDTWKSLPPPPKILGTSGEALTYGDRILLMGGNSGYTYEAYKDCLVYDITSGTWAAGPHLNIGRYHFGAALLDKKIYAVGGRGIDANAIAEVEYLVMDDTIPAVAPERLLRATGDGIESPDRFVTGRDRVPEQPVSLGGGVTMDLIATFDDEALWRRLALTSTETHEPNRCANFFGAMTFNAIAAPSILTNDRYLPEDTYYHTFSFVRAAEHALLLGLSDWNIRDKQLFIANLGDNTLTQLPVKVLSTSSSRVTPEVTLKEHGGKLEIVSSFIGFIREVGT